MPSPSTHSTEIEHRLTVVEVRQEDRQDSNEDRWATADKRLSAVETRMSLHEKAILAIAGVLQVVLQDKYPKLAQLLKNLM